ncbi:hypothetical protein ES703_31194 [subsurface metagenome]
MLRLEWMLLLSLMIFGIGDVGDVTGDVTGYFTK